MFCRAAVLTCLTALPAAALTCTGTDPNWHIEITDDTATFQYLSRTGDFTIPLTTPAQNDPDTRAYTLIGDRDTAILLVHPATCNTREIKAHVMTQDKGQPILLTGCCFPS